MAVILGSALISINAAKCTNLFWKQISGFHLNDCPQIFKQADWCRSSVSCSCWFSTWWLFEKQVIFNSIPDFVNLVQETTSVKLMDDSNWNHKDKKLFSLQMVWLWETELRSIVACRQEAEFCSEILDTRLSILGELPSRQPTLFLLQSHLKK